MTDSASTPIWPLFGSGVAQAVGSGIFVNVGRTISFMRHADAVRHFLGDSHCVQDLLADGSDGCCGDYECDDELLELLPEAARAANYTSLQFLGHVYPGLRTEPTTGYQTRVRCALVAAVSEPLVCSHLLHCAV